MKKLVVAAAAIVLLMPMVAMGADIALSHSEDLGCGACHSAHIVTADFVAGAPLWGREITVVSLLAYNNGAGTVRGVVTPGTPDGDSKLCMSCHDGITDTASSGIGTTKALGQVDTATTHPISFTYPTGAGSEAYNVSVTDGVVLVGPLTDQVECSSCHDIHANPNPSALRNADAADLCKGCHIK